MFQIPGTQLRNLLDTEREIKTEKQEGGREGNREKRLELDDTFGSLSYFYLIFGGKFHTTNAVVLSDEFKVSI